MVSKRLDGPHRQSGYFGDEMKLIIVAAETETPDCPARVQCLPITTTLVRIKGRRISTNKSVAEEGIVLSLSHLTNKDNKKKEIFQKNNEYTKM